MIRLALEPRTETPTWLALALPALAVLATLALCSVLIALAGANVLDAYRALFTGALGSRFNLVETVVKAAPLVLTGLAVAVAFRARFWNIGGEGQLLAGAMAAAFVGAREGLPGLVAGAGDDRHGCARRRRRGRAAGAAAGPAQGRRCGRHADAQLRDLLRHAGAARRPLEGPAERLSGFARHPMEAEYPMLLHAHPAPSRRADRRARRARGLVPDALDHARLPDPRRRRQPARRAPMAASRSAG